MRREPPGRIAMRLYRWEPRLPCAYIIPRTVPPSTWMVVPVTNDAAGEAMNTTTLANSCGVPSLPIGIARASSASTSSADLPSRPARTSATEVTRSVKVVPGQTLLTRMLRGAISSATDLAKPITAVRAVFDRIKWPIGCLTDVETMLVMLPPPLVSKWGIARRINRSVLIKLRLIASSQG